MTVVLVGGCGLMKPSCIQPGKNPLVYIEIDILLKLNSNLEEKPYISKLLIELYNELKTHIWDGNL